MIKSHDRRADLARRPAAAVQFAVYGSRWNWAVRRCFVVTGALGMLAAAGLTRGADEEAAGTTAAVADRHPELRRLSPTEEVWIDVERRELVIGAVVALERGAIEVLACPEMTKEHEAILATRSTARLVHAGLLAIGLEPGQPVAFSPRFIPARGPPVSVRVRWSDADGVVHESSAQEWIRNTRTGLPLAESWVFAGSSFWTDPFDGAEHYQADGGDLICVTNFPTATLDLPIESSESNEELLFEVFEGRVPPRGTTVDLILAPLPAP
jgi:hypothetical protein